MRKRCSISLFIGAALLTGYAAEKKGDAADALFRDTAIHTIRIEIPPSGLSKLTQGNRDYVRATVRDENVTLRDVGVRLKGHGTFQPVEKKPALAMKVNEFVSGQEYRGVSKFVLNNSATDASYTREWLASQLYREAGIPAARITHVRVELNGRDLGFYVLAEAMNKNFLKREFGHGSGNLYEGETKDIDQRLDQENGDDTSQSDLKALALAAQAPAAQRMTKLRSLLDVDEFASFLAMEMLTAGIDGYTFTRNNYRIYHHPKTDKMMFVPHGLDATFGSASFKPPTNSIVVRALWELPEFQQQYRARLAELAKKVWRVDDLTNRVNTAIGRLTAARADRAFASSLEEEGRRLRYQIEQQYRFIQAELKQTPQN
jgi:spore coat protein CotH